MKRPSTLAMLAWLFVAASPIGHPGAAERSSRSTMAPVPTGGIATTAPTDAQNRVLHVGPAAEYATPSAAAAAARDGDTIEIASGDYRGDVAVWNASHLRIVGGDPRPRIFAEGRDALGKGTWVVRGDDTLIENVEMSGARVADRNGAAIRIEGRHFTIRNSYLHDNENGILAGALPGSEIVVDRCEFARNGNSEGYTHNLYIGKVAKLTVTKSYLHHAIVGHNLKSRALVSIITDNRLADESDGRASYEADFPNGGQVEFAFNIVQKGARSENNTLVSYGSEGLASDVAHRFVAKGNTFISQRPGGSRFLFIAPGTDAASVTGNVFAGQGSLPDVERIRANNAVQRDLPGNVDLKPDGFR